MTTILMARSLVLGGMLRHLLVLPAALLLVASAPTLASTLPHDGVVVAITQGVPGAEGCASYPRATISGTATVTGRFDVLLDVVDCIATPRLHGGPYQIERETIAGPRNEWDCLGWCERRIDGHAWVTTAGGGHYTHSWVEARHYHTVYTGYPPEFYYVAFQETGNGYDCHASGIEFTIRCSRTGGMHISGEYTYSTAHHDTSAATGVVTYETDVVTRINKDLSWSVDCWSRSVNRWVADFTQVCAADVEPPHEP